MKKLFLNINFKLFLKVMIKYEINSYGINKVSFLNYFDEHRFQ